MILSIDHVVILVNDLEKAIADYTTLGFTVVPGGEHTDGATHNALVAFADGAYLELIAFKREAPEHRWWRYAATGEGLIDFALLPSAIAEDIAAIRERGLPMEGPFPGGRQRLDGQQIKWQTGSPPTRDLPFFCADVTPRELRVPHDSAWEHPNGAMGIHAITIAVANLEESKTHYKALLNIEPQEPVAVATNLNLKSARFSLGTASIILVEANPENNVAEKRIATSGEGPVALTLLMPSGFNGFDQSLTHSVTLAVSPKL